MERTEKEVLEILVPTTKKVILAGRTHEIKKLGFRQSLKLWNFINSFNAAARDKIVEEAEKGKLNLDMLFENQVNEKIPELFGILLNCSDVEYLKTIDDLEEISEFLLAFAEVGGLDRIAANFQKGAEKMSGLIKMMNPK